MRDLPVYPVVSRRDGIVYGPSLLLLLLAACGGGGGSSPEPVTTGGLFAGGAQRAPQVVPAFSTKSVDIALDENTSLACAENKLNDEKLIWKI